MTLGPRTHTSPSSPTGTSVRVPGSTSRTDRPGTGSPHDPGTRVPPGQFVVMGPQVSVVP
ncbi:hypothetical protein G443_001193 [Actinoalloteichus cyanogriseus DSM 43889]|uniref:Uncharacterized protein n=1 Tax=Actinoalloteichus caeruleus DSM 43889 TaxID=1120930 RepID=A0ABT1JEJ7_ACTCY|nr:hypothetical protein [Actinoalloteichus caeruleus DSM 43889]